MKMRARAGSGSGGKGAEQLRVGHRLFQNALDDAALLCLERLPCQPVHQQKFLKAGPAALERHTKLQYLVKMLSAVYDQGIAVGAGQVFRRLGPGKGADGELVLHQIFLPVAQELCVLSGQQYAEGADRVGLERFCWGAF